MPALPPADATRPRPSTAALGLRNLLQREGDVSERGKSPDSDWLDEQPDKSAIAWSTGETAYAEVALFTLGARSTGRWWIAVAGGHVLISDHAPEGTLDAAKAAAERELREIARRLARELGAALGERL